MAHSTPEEGSKLSRLAKSSASQSPLALWVEQHERQLGLSIRGRFRGNSLHLLCEFPHDSDTFPSQSVVCRHFKKAVDYTELNHLIPPGYPRIRHMWLYGRVHGAKKPEWTAPLHLNVVQRKGTISKPMGTLPEASPCEFSTEATAEVAKSPQPFSKTVSSPQHKSQEHSALSSRRAIHSTPNKPKSLAVQSRSKQTLPQHVENRGNLYSRAEQGHPEAIAYYLRDVLVDLGVEASVRVKVQRNRPNTTKDRLWVTCHGPYSPAAALVGDPIARQLRALSLHNVEDALLQFQVRGEDGPDWVLRIDLTPQEDMLRSWAEWGDVEAISRLVNQVLQPLNGQLLEATLKGITLHLSCTSLPPVTAPDQDAVSREKKTSAGPVVSDPWISPNEPSSTKNLESLRTRKVLETLLTSIKPQGIQNVVVYGQQIQATNPDWIEWIDIHQDMDRTASPLELAGNGDLDAIAFLIHRVLNTDLNEQLATGGQRVQVLLKKRLLHIMCDAPLCPEEEDVVPEVERLLRSLTVPGIEGLRIYGRRAGQRRPRWTEAIDFVKQPQMVPEPAPQFAATDAYVTELVTPSTEPIIRADITASDLWDKWQTGKQRLIQSIRRFVLASQLVVPTADSPELMLRSTPRTANVKTALVWTAVGALALVQTDLGLHQLTKLNINRVAVQPRDQVVTQSPSLLDDSLPDDSQGENITNNAQDPFLESLSFGNNGDNSPLPPSAELSQSEDEDTIFDSSGFTTRSAGTDAVPTSTEATPTDNASETAPVETVAAVLDSPYPSFNSEQLDFKLALYHQRVLEVGPPDILILGSSRALRGIDPAALEDALAQLGYNDADIFNFGINGATAQVVELIVERILLPEQLPKLIVWADGARAFNSGRDDRTFNGILASEGYEQLLSGPLLSLSETPAGLANGALENTQGLGSLRTLGPLSQSLADSYQTLDDDLSETLALASASHPRRDRIKSVLQHGLTRWLPQPNNGATGSSFAANTALDEMHPTDQRELSGDLQSQAVNHLSVDASTSFRALENIDNDGFLPLQIRFDPTQYYQSYARVAGNYDRDYSNFRVEGVQGSALSTLLTASRTYDIPIVFINMPLTEEYLDPFRMGHEQTFRQYMLNLALQEETFIFRDLGELWLDNSDHRRYFSDPSHLNQYGADEVSRHISRDPMIPWDVTTR